jgi:hypothetical protein
MLFLVVLLVPIVTSVAIYHLFVRFELGRHYWVRAAKATAIIAGLRIALVSAGAYLLENTSGWLQLPAYCIALLGLPELLLFPRPIWGRSDTLVRWSNNRWDRLDGCSWLRPLPRIARDRICDRIQHDQHVSHRPNLSTADISSNPCKTLRVAEWQNDHKAWGCQRQELSNLEGNRENIINFRDEVLEGTRSTVIEENVCYED